MSSLKDASHDCLLVAVKGGKVVQGREEDDNIIFKPDCPGHYDLYCKDIFTSSYTG